MNPKEGDAWNFFSAGKASGSSHKTLMMKNLKWLVIFAAIWGGTFSLAGMAGQSPKAQQQSTRGYGNTSFDVADRSAILNLLGAYQYFYDEQDVDQYLTLFTDDLVVKLHIPGSPLIHINGKPAYRKLITQRMADLRLHNNDRRHVFGQPFLIEQTRTTARVICRGSLNAISGNEFKPVMTIGYDGRFVKRNGEWRIKEWNEKADISLDIPYSKVEK